MVRRHRGYHRKLPLTSPHIEDRELHDDVIYRTGWPCCGSMAKPKVRSSNEHTHGPKPLVHGSQSGAHGGSGLMSDRSAPVTEALRHRPPWDWCRNLCLAANSQGIGVAGCLGVRYRGSWLKTEWHRALIGAEQPKWSSTPTRHHTRCLAQDREGS